MVELAEVQRERRIFVQGLSVCLSVLAAVISVLSIGVVVYTIFTSGGSVSEKAVTSTWNEDFVWPLFAVNGVDYCPVESVTDYFSGFHSVHIGERDLVWNHRKFEMRGTIGLREMSIGNLSYNLGYSIKAVELEGERIVGIAAEDQEHILEPILLPGTLPKEDVRSLQLQAGPGQSARVWGLVSEVSERLRSEGLTINEGKPGVQIHIFFRHTQREPAVSLTTSGKAGLALGTAILSQWKTRLGWKTATVNSTVGNGEQEVNLELSGNLDLNEEMRNELVLAILRFRNVVNGR